MVKTAVEYKMVKAAITGLALDPALQAHLISVLNPKNSKLGGCMGNVQGANGCGFGNLTTM